MQETKKQEAIRLAYGEYWKHWKSDINQEGVLTTDLPIPNEMYLALKLNRITGSFYLPNALTGISDNNGWTQSDLPTDDEPIWVMIDGLELPELVQPNSSEDECHSSDGFIYNSRHITHYQPIVKPKPPIY